MAFRQSFTYKCKKCGYKKTIISGDVILPLICPKCGEIMELYRNKENLLEKILKILKW